VHTEISLSAEAVRTNVFSHKLQLPGSSLTACVANAAGEIQISDFAL
jgi:hypothetical protein